MYSGSTSSLGTASTTLKLDNRHRSFFTRSGDRRRYLDQNSSGLEVGEEGEEEEAEDSEDEVEDTEDILRLAAGGALSDHGVE